MSIARFDRKKRTISAVLETLELRRMLSASMVDPIAFPLYTANPADGSLSDGATTPPASAFTPAQIKSAYGISSIKLNGIVGDGSGQTIAIVTAFDDPALVSSSSASFATSDLHIFDQQFGLPDPPSFTKVQQTSGGNTPDVGWAEEAALDVEWTHAIAPAAKIVLVEASGAGAVQLLDWGISTAAKYSGVSVVSTSFGFGEFSGESSYDSLFTTPAGHGGVTFVSSTGDTGAPGIYPSFSPHVVAVGGTHLSLSGSSYSSEVGYSSSGGGASAYEDKPAYQSNLTESFSQRLTPDVSFDGDPNTGVDVYDSYNGGFPGWYKIAGTSFSAPAWAGLIAIANQGRAGAKMAALDGVSQTLPKLYSIPSSDFHDITSGNNGFPAGAGYDLVTGRGTPIANLLVPDLAGVPSGSTTNTASIAGTVYVDTNSNGKLDSGEVGLSGVQLYVDTNKNGVLDSGESTFTTPSTGAYSFGSLAAGTTQIREVVPSGYKLTNPAVGYYNVTLTTGQKVTGENFGNAKVVTATTGSIAGTSFLDANSNGTLDSGETGFASRIYMDINQNGGLDSGEPSYPTASNGIYKFNGIPAGTYQLREVVPSGYTLTTTTTGYILVTLASGAVTGVNFGNAKITTTTNTASVSGTVYTDTNSNGKLDSGEAGLSGVELFVDSNKNGVLDSGEPTFTTTSTGTYTFGSLPAGATQIREVVPFGYKLTNPSVGFLNTILATGQKVTGANFGNAKSATTGTASIAGTVYFDTNSNGKLDSGEVGLSTKLFIDLNKNGALDSGEPSFTTTSSGVYSFSGLPAGTYQVREVVPSGYKLTNPAVGYLSVTVTSGAVTGQNFGNAKVTTAKIIGSISGFVYVDANSNGKFDTGEKPLAGVTMFLDTNKNGKLDNGETSTTTDATGYYYLGVTTASIFRVVEIKPSGYHLTNPTAGFYDIQVNGGWNVKNENWGNLL